jgi:delta 1-pyrroline-5-carboxylate dehydrogenase
MTQIDLSPPRARIGADYRHREPGVVAPLIEEAALAPASLAATQALAARLAEGVRAERQRAGGVDALMLEFSLDSREGIALMCLAEALDPRVAGVLFTGSTEVAHLINRTLVQRSDDPVLIAETSGQNAMSVDSSALPEQVVADALASAFDSAGQRCSALRILCVQEDVADRVLQMLRGAMDELRVGDIGAVVGVQPFGGEGLSGTGPKAGGPHYLWRLVRGAQPHEAAGPQGDATLPGPTGESNTLRLLPRGRVACIAPSAPERAKQARLAERLGNIALLTVSPDSAPDAVLFAGTDDELAVVRTRLAALTDRWCR